MGCVCDVLGCVGVKVCVQGVESLYLGDHHANRMVAVESLAMMMMMMMMMMISRHHKSQDGRRGWLGRQEEWQKGVRGE